MIFYVYYRKTTNFKKIKFYQKLNLYQKNKLFFYNNQNIKKYLIQNHIK